MRLTRLLYTLPLLVLLMTGFLPLSQAQEESEADEQKAWQQFHQEFNQYEVQDGQKRQFLQGEEHLQPMEEGPERTITEAIRYIMSRTPFKVKEEFRKIHGTEVRVHLTNGTIWEPDHFRHGGSDWKVWLYKNYWDKGRPPWSVTNEGVILRIPKKC